MTHAKCYETIRNPEGAINNAKGLLRVVNHLDGQAAIPANAPRGHSTVRFWRDFDHHGVQSGGF